MKIIFGHTNMDLDCFGSIALIKYLYPDYQLVQSHLIHPAARNLYTPQEAINRTSLVQRMLVIAQFLAKDIKG